MRDHATKLDEFVTDWLVPLSSSSRHRVHCLERYRLIKTHACRLSMFYIRASRISIWSFPTPSKAA
ncbi:hypothetical protein WK03_02850 [Burkholderia cepacia]|nr:hypothetical protein WK03_02850 [Burkholderia cepacia]